MTELDRRLDSLLDGRREKKRFRSLKEYDTTPESGLADFSSNDYLSLTSSASLRKAYLSKLESTPSIFGSTGSRLLSGCTPSHSSLEKRFERFFNSPAALLFNSGWDANVSFFATVPQPNDWVIYDELVHASVHSGVRASRIPIERRLPFNHNDPAHLEKVLKRMQNTASTSKDTSTVFVALESLYSMDGDFSPLPTLLDILENYIPRRRLCVVLDEAHSTGVYGQQGRGITYALGEEGGRVDVRLMTFGKAVGCSGAVLLCSPTVRSFLINFARPLIFSTALPHSTIIALECVWDILQNEEGDQRRQSLMSLAEYIHNRLDQLLSRTPPNILHLPPDPILPFPQATDLPAKPGSPILGLLTPTPHALSAFLLEKGFIVRPVVPPTVPPGAERVRICLRAGMDEKMIDGLIAALTEWVHQQTTPVADLRAKL
uniref:8-amino-7-oxononanoate synthase n=1 Tax=Kwoniella dejecticola CBS 10117 TaxID=1296121 RepID=A0A1A6A5C5_9TREE|nr:8-amino-7-oxononanoate synthase [Kwoniella dejecticola CBS 10117]OBR85262.1 8-amino-7-oxononanoate synthase [Kwoniella dejecticola CBS 10117]